MERWNELIAGHVLDNLTEEEQEELSQVLAKQPKLMTEISRLRRTATLRSCQQLESGIDAWQAGAEGWADMVSQRPEQPSEADLRCEESVEPARTEPRKTHLVFNGSANTAVSLSSQMHHLPAASQPRKGFFQSTRAWFGLMLVALIAVSVDNWRMRRLLAIAQEQILQIESTAEYIPARSD
ncbi:MAG: hypothetical protein AAFP07_05075 [Cyanobacteria bacterium J06606_4]